MVNQTMPLTAELEKTALHREAATALRRSAIRTGQVKILLRLAPGELNRWDAEGRLPHSFKRFDRRQRGTWCRYWLATEVVAAAERVDAWRAQDRQEGRT